MERTPWGSPSLHAVPAADAVRSHAAVPALALLQTSSSAELTTALWLRTPGPLCLLRWERAAAALPPRPQAVPGTAGPSALVCPAGTAAPSPWPPGLSSPARGCPRSPSAFPGFVLILPNCIIQYLLRKGLLLWSLLFFPSCLKYLYSALLNAVENLARCRIMGQKLVFLGIVRTVGVPATVFLRPVCCPLIPLLCDLFVFSREF